MSGLPPVALVCPSCREVLAFREIVTPGWTGGAFGVLECPCSRYPVLDAIPVLRRGRVDVQDHMTGRAEVVGPTVDDLADRVECGQGVDALVDLLAFPPPSPFGLDAVRGLRLPFTRGPWARAALAARRAEVHAMLDDVDAWTAQDWMELCYLRSSDRVNRELYPYFFVRFGQPRHLASLDLLQALPTGDRPVLDLACGFGHILFNLAARADAVDAVGVDRNFFQLWVARRYVAPTQTFVCCDAVESLPFLDDAFSASVCTDAFHLFDHQQDAMDELRRVAQHDTVFLDRIGNADLEPHDTPRERSPAGYADLVRGAPRRIRSQDELIADYRRGRGAQLAEDTPPEAYDRRKWLSLVTSRDTSSFVDHGGFGSVPPHGAGPLRINPVYDVVPDGDDVRLAFSFPSTWYAFENASVLDYTSAGERVDPATFAALADGRTVAQTTDFLARFVVIALPERYARRPGSSDGPTSVGAGLRAGVRARVRASLTAGRRDRDRAGR